jgi:hypothetical protein
MNSTAVAAILIVCAIILIVTTSIANAYKSKRAMRSRIIASWGKEAAGTYKSDDLSSIPSYFLNRCLQRLSAFTIDDITWRDLDMDEVFTRLNNTESTPGEETLYRLLREPCFESELLQAREKLIACFQNQPENRLRVQMILARLGKKRLLDVTGYLFSSQAPQPWRSLSYKLLAATALLVPLLLLVDPGLGALAIALSFLTNMLVHYNARSKIGADLEALNYIVRLVRCARALAGLNIESLEEPFGRLRSCHKKLCAIEKKGFYSSFSTTGALADLAVEYIKIILLKELIDYEYQCKAVYEFRRELIEVYDIIGLIDSLIAVASYRKYVASYSEPLLAPSSMDRPRFLEFEDIYHPLINKPVLNSLATDQSVLVTGSNASGKSTLLKTIAVNAIFAQSIHTCLARKYSSSFFAVFTSMALKDSVRDGESYFIAEIKSIKRILSYLNERVPCLCFIDEVLRGTNTVERIAASSQVLLHLAGSFCICMAATHDIELTFILEGIYRNVHFQERIVDDGIVFDYRLYDGRATSRNAIKLLRLMGYDEAIVNEAEDRANQFISRSSWKEISGSRGQA